MYRIDIFQLSEFTLEPECWIRIGIEFITEHSSLTDKELLSLIKGIIISSPITFHDIFETCLIIFQLSSEINFDSAFFKSIKDLFNIGFCAKKASETLSKCLKKLK